MNTSKNASALTPSDSVRVVQNQDGAVLLDVQQGLCFSLTQVGVKIWELLRLNSSVDQIAEALAAEFSVPRPQVYEDVVAFISDLKHKGLLLSNSASKGKRHLPRSLALLLLCRRTCERWFSSRSRAQRFLSWKAFIAVFAFDLLRFGSSFPRLHEFVQSWTIAPRTAPADAVEQACRAVNWACVWYPKRVLCLQRSVVTTCLLRNCGVAAQMAMGAQKFPFKAHAWTEVEGRAINERRDVQSIYMVWDRC